MSTKTYTVFCQHSESPETTWISAVEAVDAEDAAKRGRVFCAQTWGVESPEDVLVIGVATGKVQIELWDDNGLNI